MCVLSPFCRKSKYLHNQPRMNMPPECMPAVNTSKAIHPGAWSRIEAPAIHTIIQITDISFLLCKVPHWILVLFQARRVTCHENLKGKSEVCLSVPRSWKPATPPPNSVRHPKIQRSLLKTETGEDPHGSLVSCLPRIPAFLPILFTSLSHQPAPPAICHLFSAFSFRPSFKCNPPLRSFFLYSLLCHSVF